MKKINPGLLPQKLKANLWFDCGNLFLLCFAFTVFSCATGTPNIANETEAAAVTRTVPPPAVSPAAGNTVNLDAALGEFSVYITGRLPDATLTAVAVTDVPEKRVGNYIADELAVSLVNTSGLRMVSRQDMERILAEQNVQAGLNFNDETTAKIGHNLGWQTIIYGGVEALKETYRLSLRAVDVESGELRGIKSYMLAANDPVLINLVNPNVAVEDIAERDDILRPFSGGGNNFELTVSTPKTVYYDDEEMFITLSANADCYFMVYHLDVNNEMKVIYPNPWDRDTNFIKANVRKTIPENSTFLLHAPYGEERILVYASTEPIKIAEDQYTSRSLSRGVVASEEAAWASSSRGLSVVPRNATGQFRYTILPKK